MFSVDQPGERGQLRSTWTTEINVEGLAGLSRACMPVCSSSDLARTGVTAVDTGLFGSFSLLSCVERHSSYAVSQLFPPSMVGVQFTGFVSGGARAAQHGSRMVELWG